LRADLMKSSQPRRPTPAEGGHPRLSGTSADNGRNASDPLGWSPLSSRRRAAVIPVSMGVFGAWTLEASTSCKQEVTGSIPVSGFVEAALVISRCDGVVNVAREFMTTCRSSPAPDEMGAITRKHPSARYARTSANLPLRPRARVRFLPSGAQHTRSSAAVKTCRLQRSRRPPA